MGSKLLVATDHQFLRHSGGVYDLYCFGRSFFDDYRSAFDRVHVAARVKHEPVISVSERADGDGVSFVDLPDIHGPVWTIGAPLLCGSDIRKAVEGVDAVCVRLPSQIGNCAGKWARLLRKPLMFELIGDPAEQFRASGLAARAWGRISAHRTKDVISSACVGSYVSRSHLQKLYPPGSRARTDSISSIRLPSSEIIPPRIFSLPPVPLRLILVASLVPVKRHEMLLRSVQLAIERGLAVELTLVGDGPLRSELEHLVEHLGIKQQVHFRGHVAGKGPVFAQLDAADLFVMTSASEGMPRAMIEAMARGLPAVGTAVGGIGELLGPDQLVPPDDFERLSELLCRLGSDPGFLSELAKRSHSQALTFESEKLSTRRRSLLQELRNLTVDRNDETAVAAVTVGTSSLAHQYFD